MKGILSVAAPGAVLVAVIMVVPGAMASTGHPNSGTEPKMVGSQWAVYEEKTLPNGYLNFYPGAHATTIPTGGVEFAMPEAAGSSPTWVNYIENTYRVALTESAVVTAQINVLSGSSTSFVGDTFGGINLAQPAFVRLFIQSNLPNDHSATCTGGGNVNNYWWADVSSYTFVNGPGGGSATLSVPFAPSDWSNICGQSGASNAGAFDLAIASTTIIGLSFGSGFFFASGVGVTGTPATFQLLSYTISY